MFLKIPVPCKSGTGIFIWYLKLFLGYKIFPVFFKKPHLFSVDSLKKEYIKKTKLYFHFFIYLLI